MKKLIVFLIIATCAMNANSQIAEGLSNKIIIAKELPVADRIKIYVEENITTWQQKGKYESLAEYTKRVNEQTRDAKIKKLTSEALASIAKEEFNKNKGKIVSNYDAESQLFKINIKGFESIYVPIPRTEAENFGNNLAEMTFSNVKYTFNANNIIVKNANIKNPANGKIYAYDASKPVTFNSVVVDNTFKDVQIDIGPLQTYTASGNVTQSTKKVTVGGNSDVDINIPRSAAQNKNSFAVIIGNENYKNEIRVKYAVNDALTFKDYAVKTLGIPEKQVHYVTDATFGTMLDEIDWLNNVTKAYGGQAKVIFYYAGHGMPDETSKSAYLLPVDGTSSRSRTAIKVDELYAKLTEYPSQQITVFLDACFSGGSRDGMLASGRGVRITPKAGVLKGNLVIFSAVSGSQTAHPYEEEQHGLFTYYLLKKIQETKGEASYQELGDYINTQVNRKSVVNNKEQNPKINVSIDVENTWQSWKLK